MIRNKRKIFILILFIIFLLALYIAIFAGYNDNGIGMFVKTLNLSDNDSDSIILKLLRYPRALKSIIAGSCLALAGLFMQSVSKNPLAEPYITGVSSGAGLGIVISVLYFNSSNYSLFGFAGALISSLSVICFAGLNRFSITKLILTGLAVNLFAGSLISLFILTNPQKAQSILFILSGGFNSSNIISDKTLFFIFILGIIISCYFIPKLNFMRIDNGILSSFKKEKDIYTLSAIIISAFLTSLSVFAAGILGFIGIIIPQITKMFIGNDYRYLFFANILAGASLVLFSDYLSRVLFYPLQIPLGLVIAITGAPVFVFFLTKKGDIFSSYDRN